jgi:hypothetical protein
MVKALPASMRLTDPTTRCFRSFALAMASGSCPLVGAGHRKSNKVLAMRHSNLPCFNVVVVVVAAGRWRIPALDLLSSSLVDVVENARLVLVVFVQEVVVIHDRDIG